MLATKTVVFIGYSLRDSDFSALYRLMQRRMKEILPRSYVVTPGDGAPSELAEGMHLIRTNGVHFLTELKGTFGDEFVPDSRFEAIPMMREFVRMMHHHMIDQGEMRDEPEMLVCASYQDGLMDAFDHQMANKAAGKYSHRCYTVGLVSETYQHLHDRKLGAKHWLDVAYIEGYRNGLTFLIADDDARKQMPLYFVFGCEDSLRTYEEYREVADDFATLNRQAFEYANDQASKLAPGVVFQHLPSLA
jgi:hypothetical protein